MSEFTVVLSFQADSLEDAEKIVGSWSLSAGVTLVNVTGVMVSDLNMVPLEKAGKVSDGIKAHAAKAEAPDAPLPQAEHVPAPAS